MNYNAVHQCIQQPSISQFKLENIFRLRAVLATGTQGHRGGALRLKDGWRGRRSCGAGGVSPHRRTGGAHRAGITLALPGGRMRSLERRLGRVVMGTQMSWDRDRTFQDVLHHLWAAPGPGA